MTHTKYLPTTYGRALTPTPSRQPRGKEREGRKGSGVVGGGGDEGGGTRAHVWSAVYRSIERTLWKPVHGFRTTETTDARHVAAATLTNSTAFEASFCSGDEIEHRRIQVVRKSYLFLASREEGESSKHLKTEDVSLWIFKALNIALYILIYIIHVLTIWLANYWLLNMYTCNKKIDDWKPVVELGVFVRCSRFNPD